MVAVAAAQESDQEARVNEHASGHSPCSSRYAFFRPLRSTGNLSTEPTDSDDGGRHAPRASSDGAGQALAERHRISSAAVRDIRFRSLHERLRESHGEGFIAEL